jgi:hypothetical protein
MPMIDVYAAAGTFSDRHTLARDLAVAVMRWEQVPDLPLFAKNTAAFSHEMDQPRSPTSRGTATTSASRSSRPSACSTATSSSASSRSSQRSSLTRPAIQA